MPISLHSIRNFPICGLSIHIAEVHYPSSAWAAVSARVRRRSTQTRGLDLAVAWIVTACQYVSLGQRLQVKAGSPVPMALGLLLPRGRRTRPRSAGARWNPSRIITAP